jgi:helix-turn-helix protein
MSAEIITKEDLQSFKVELLQELTSLINTKKADQKEWLKSADVRKMLGISPGTLQNLRISGTLAFTKIGGTIFYAYADVIKVLQKNKREATH